MHGCSSTTKTRFARSCEVAFKLAMETQKSLTNVHKSNVLKSSVLWNEVLDEVHKDFSEVNVETF